MPKTKKTSRPSEMYCDPCSGSGKKLTLKNGVVHLRDCLKCGGSGSIPRPDRPKKTKLLLSCA